jgi:hypothetical protein
MRHQRIYWEVLGICFQPTLLLKTALPYWSSFNTESNYNLFEMNKTLVVFSILFISHLLIGQKSERVAFYNVENLFDTIDGPNNDEEFLPGGKKQWNLNKYKEKITHINKVIGTWWG